MLQIIVAYNSATNIITLTSLSSVVGTIADVGNAQLQVTGIPSGYTAQIDYGVKVYNNTGIPINPSDALMIADTTGTVMISDGVLQATKEDGILPIQLVLDDTDVGIHIASYNQLRLDVKKAIDATGKVLALYRSSIQKAFIDAQISDTVIIFYPLDGDIPVTIDLSGMFQKPLSAGDNVTIELGTSTDVISATVPVKSVNARTGDITLVKADVGLGNADNTSDLDKPVSTLQQTALNLKVDKVTGKALSTNDYTTEDKNKLSGIEVGAEVNVNADWNATEGDSKILNKPTLGTAASKDTGIIAGNVPVLNDSGKLADEVMPAVSISEYAGAVDYRTDLTGLTAQKGDWAQVTSESGDNLSYNGAYLLNGDSIILANWIQITSVGGSSGTVYSVNGRVGIVVLSPTDVNLGNCNNTSDADKPISNATQSALNAKQATITGAATTIVSSNLTTSKALVSDASGKVDVSAVTSTELGYVAGVTSAIQTQFTSKAPTSHASSATTYGVSSATDYGHAKASSTTPIMDGTAGAGAETTSFARGDHVHPTDTSRTPLFTVTTDSANAIVSLTPVANNIYKYTVSGGLTSLTINTVPVSDYEIIIYFTSSTSFTFTDSSGCTWIDADPTFAVSKSYVISFLNGIGVWGEAQ